MSIILITAPAVAPASVQVYQSDTVEGARTLIQTFTYSGLVVDVDTGKLILDDAGIDQTKFRWINYVSSLGEAGPSGVMYPIPVSAGVARLDVNLALWGAAGRTPVQNACLRVAPYTLPFKDSTWVGTKGPWQVKTDENGLASISVPLGAHVTVTLKEAGLSNIEITNTVPVMNLVDYI
jgi:hypothetical protein